jgi:hypothetical protein
MESALGAPRRRPRPINQETLPLRWAPLAAGPSCRIPAAQDRRLRLRQPVVGVVIAREYLVDETHGRVTQARRMIACWRS